MLIDRHHAQRHRKAGGDSVTRLPLALDRRPAIRSAVDRDWRVVDAHGESLAPARDAQPEAEAERAFELQRKVGCLSFGVASVLPQADALSALVPRHLGRDEQVDSESGWIMEVDNVVVVSNCL